MLFRLIMVIMLFLSHIRIFFKVWDVLGFFSCWWRGEGLGLSLGSFWWGDAIWGIFLKPQQGKYGY